MLTNVNILQLSGSYEGTTFFDQAIMRHTQFHYIWTYLDKLYVPIWINSANSVEVAICLCGILFFSHDEFTCETSTLEYLSELPLDVNPSTNYLTDYVFKAESW